MYKEIKTKSRLRSLSKLHKSLLHSHLQRHPWICYNSIGTRTFSEQQIHCPLTKFAEREAIFEALSEVRKLAHVKKLVRDLLISGRNATL